MLKNRRKKQRRKIRRNPRGRLTVRQLLLGALVSSTLLISSCALLESAGVTAGSSAVGAGAGYLIGNPVAGAIIGAGAGGVLDQAIVSPKTCPEPVTGFFPLLGKLVEIGGWLLALLIVVPLVLGYLIPAPQQKIKPKVVKPDDV